ncbi:hypothetical protein [Embleya sp. NPDC001921]
MSGYATAEDLRAFLRLCLDPGPGRDKRTVAKLADLTETSLSGLAEEIAEHAPHLADLLSEVKRARAVYVEALRGWIADEPPPAPTPEPPTGECPMCGRRFRIIKGGLLRRHGGITPSGYSSGMKCLGSGWPPARDGAAC